MNVMPSLWGFLITVFLVVYMIYVRSRRKDVLAKHKPGSSQHKLFMMLLDGKLFTIAIAMLLIFVASIVWQIATTPPDAKSSPLFVTVFFLGSFTVMFLVALFMQRSKVKEALTESKKSRKQ